MGENYDYRLTVRVNRPELQITGKEREMSGAQTALTAQFELIE